MQQDFFSFDPKLESASKEAIRLCAQSFERIDETAHFNSQKVLSAFISGKVSESHFSGSTGYGYGDRGRDVLDEVFSKTFGTKIHLCDTILFQELMHWQLLCSACCALGIPCFLGTGKPYDTLDEVIGIKREGFGSLLDFGVKYKQLDMLEKRNS